MADADVYRVTWFDHKRYLWPVALVMPLLPFAAIALHAATGSGVWLWLGPIVILGVVPVIDLVAGLDRANPPDSVMTALESDRYYRWIIFAFLPLHYAGFVAGMHVIARGDLTTSEKVGLAVTVGFITGLGINTAHELGHKRESHERWLAKIALAPAAYGHFYIEHNRGHHVRVATPVDPASSRVGESFYRFWPRSVGCSAINAWRLESRRYARRHQSPWRVGNDVLNAWAMTLVLWAVMVTWLGVGVLPYLVIQGVMGFTLLEAVNYLEHYGLLRERVGAGDNERWERVEPRHSWNSNNLTTNVLLYHLQRHSDHHAAPTRRYQALRDDVDAPVLPTGYAGMILLALVPPVWRRVMDPRVLAHYDGDMSRANITPSKRGRVLRRYAVPASAAPRAVVTAGAPGERAGDAPLLRCPGCGFTYDVDAGLPREGFAPGTRWSGVPDSWACPDCGVRDKLDFVPVERA